MRGGLRVVKTLVPEGSLITNVDKNVRKGGKSLFIMLKVQAKFPNSKMVTVKLLSDSIENSSSVGKEEVCY